MNATPLPTNLASRLEQDMASRSHKCGAEKEPLPPSSAPSAAATLVEIPDARNAEYDAMYGAGFSARHAQYLGAKRKRMAELDAQAAGQRRARDAIEACNGNLDKAFAMLLGAR